MDKGVPPGVRRVTATFMMGDVLHLPTPVIVHCVKAGGDVPRNEARTHLNHDYVCMSCTRCMD
ncbi:MAG: hypothetical protein AAB547_03045 [Patescibacteria group bacterium]